MKDYFVERQSNLYWGRVRAKIPAFREDRLRTRLDVLARQEILRALATQPVDIQRIEAARKLRKANPERPSIPIVSALAIALLIVPALSLVRTDKEEILLEGEAREFSFVALEQLQLTPLLRTHEISFDSGSETFSYDVPTQNGDTTRDGRWLLVQSRQGWLEAAPLWSAGSSTVTYALEEPHDSRTSTVVRLIVIHSPPPDTTIPISMSSGTRIFDSGAPNGLALAQSAFAKMSLALPNAAISVDQELSEDQGCLFCIPGRVALDFSRRPRGLQTLSVSFPRLRQLSRSLGSAEVKLKAEGRLERIQTAPGAIHFRFSGVATKLEFDQQSVFPSWLEIAETNYLLASIWAGVVFLFGLLVGVLKWARIIG